MTTMITGTAVTLPGGERYRLGTPATVDWEATLRFRHHRWRYGFGVAEAMDTAQRGMGLDYPAARELIRRSSAEARVAGGSILAGVGTDQLPPGPSTVDLVGRAYLEQLADVLDAGAVPVLMCGRELAAAARGTDDYLRVYDELIGQSTVPVVLHWLGEAFDPQLAGYWGSSNLDHATETLLTLIRLNADRIDAMVGGQQSARSPVHLVRVLRLADEAGLLPDAELAAARARAYLTTAGVAQ